MSSTGDDEAWRAIVENYGDRPTLPEHDLDEQPRDARPGADLRDGPRDHPGEDEPRDGDTLEGDAPGRREEDPDAALARALQAEERYVPPVPPPTPLPEPRRLVAWLGLFGAPALLLVLLVAGVSLPSWAAYSLVAWFVGGFVYLVAHMPRGPGDPFDDGARV